MRPIHSSICVHDDHLFLPSVIRACSSVGNTVVFVSRLAWHGAPGDWHKTVALAELCGAEVIIGDWADEQNHRRAALSEMRRRGLRHILIPDSDEIPSTQLLESLQHIVNSDLAELVRVRMQTYWKTTQHIVTPPESLAPLLLIDAQLTEHGYIREYFGGRELILSRDHGLLHHLSYAGPDSRILKKTQTWGHRSEVVANWWESKWQGWDRDPTIRDLHPTHPTSFRSITRLTNSIPDLEGVDCGRQISICPDVEPSWPTVSVIIPLYGGGDDLKECLASLCKIQDLLHEVIVVDDASPDDAASVVVDFDFATLISHNHNQGFAAACNTGLAASSGEVILFLNSDTIVPRAGLIRLIESLIKSDDVGAVGPLTDNAGHFQKIEPAFADPEDIEMFAIDFAQRIIDDEHVSMLVGFCLAMPATLAKKLGGFSTEFGSGMFEDNEICFRIQELGYKLILSNRAFVRHKGSRSLSRLDISPAHLLRKNERIFLSKRSEMVNCGYASHLPGERREPIRFDPSRSQEAIRTRLAELSDSANISLCMIVRNEERVLADCLTSAKGVFRQIVIVDTGSTDQTIDIAKRFGSEIHQIVWPDNFSAARNESIKYASGNWIFWMDADDVLPPETAEKILLAAINAPEWVTGFVVPVQFVDGPTGEGTRVDHVKLFRNVPNLAFEGRIHEQILPSLRKHGGEIQRIKAVVLHSGYDTSEEGQAGKRVRDTKLLALDLAERPGHPFVLFNLGMTAHYNGSHSEAVDWFRKCLECSIPAESHVRKVFALLSGSLKALGDMGAAMHVLGDGLQHYPGDPELLFLRGVLRMGRGEFGEARLDLERIPDTMPEHFASFDAAILGFKKFFNLGICCGGLGDFAGEKHYLLLAIDSGGSESEAPDILFDSAIRRSDFLTAEAVVQRLAQTDGKGERYGAMLVQLLKAQGHDIAERLKLIAASNPADPRIHAILAKFLLENRRMSEAWPILNFLRNNGAPQGSFFMGVSAANAGDSQSAMKWFEETIALDPSHTAARQYLARVTSDMKHNGEPVP